MNKKKEKVFVPKTTWAPSNQVVATVVMKNWDPLVFFPALAIDRIPGLVCFNLKFSSKNIGKHKKKKILEKK